MSDSRSAGFTEISVPEAYDRFMSRQLFEPWACELIAAAGVRDVGSVLDVATGPGTVARLIAAEIGEAGRVVGADISPAMLGIAAAKAAEPGSASIEYVECSATALAAADASFQLVLCQQGLQFFPDRIAAVHELYRVLALGGVAVASSWAAERPLGLFGPMIDTLSEFGIPEPYPRAFDASSYALTVSDLRELFESAGFRDVSVQTVELECVWETSDDAVATISGTPYGPLLAELADAQRQRIYATLSDRLGGSHHGKLTVKTASNIARGVRKDAGSSVGSLDHVEQAVREFNA
jgi:ubiquinone/menaquinone biosynthesis C-methylase UbiE